MSSFSRDLSEIDGKTKLTVTGFIRRFDEILSSSSDMILFQNIPSLIVTIVTFYYYIGEHWKICHEGMEISNDGATITQITATGDCIGSGYASTEIISSANMICEWHIKASSGGTTSSGWIQNDRVYAGIGISSINDPDKVFLKTSINGWAYVINAYSGQKKIVKPTDIGSVAWESCTKPMEIGGILKITLNLRDAIMRVKMGDNEEMIAFENIKKRPDISYRLAVTSYPKGTAMSIVKFNEKYT